MSWRRLWLCGGVAAAVWLALAVTVGWTWIAMAAGVAAMALAAVGLRLPARASAAAVVLVAVGAFASLEAYNRLAYDTLSLSGPPPAISWGGREYRTFSTADPTVRPRTVGHVRQVGVTPSDTPYFASSACATVHVCGVIFVKAPHGRMYAYDLQGSP
jgi:hypothetical protein